MVHLNKTFLLVAAALYLVVSASLQVESRRLKAHPQEVDSINNPAFGWGCKDDCDDHEDYAASRSSGRHLHPKTTLPARRGEEDDGESRRAEIDSSLSTSQFTKHPYLTDAEFKKMREEELKEGASRAGFSFKFSSRLTKREAGSKSRASDKEENSKEKEKGRKKGPKSNKRSNEGTTAKPTDKSTTSSKPSEAPKSTKGKKQADAKRQSSSSTTTTTGKPDSASGSSTTKEPSKSGDSSTSTTSSPEDKDVDSEEMEKLAKQQDDEKKILADLEKRLGAWTQWLDSNEHRTLNKVRALRLVKTLQKAVKKNGIISTRRVASYGVQY